MILSGNLNSCDSLPAKLPYGFEIIEPMNTWRTARILCWSPVFNQYIQRKEVITVRPNETASMAYLREFGDVLPNGVFVVWKNL